MPVTKNSQSGFSLIELLVAIVILAVGLLGLAELQVTAIKVNSQSATATAATAIAQKAIEDVLAMSPDHAMFDTSDSGTFTPVTVDGGGTYNVSWSVETPFEGVSNLCQVTIVVESDQDVQSVFGSRKRTVTVHTLKRAI